MEEKRAGRCRDPGESLLNDISSLHEGGRTFAESVLDFVDGWGCGWHFDRLSGLVFTLAGSESGGIVVFSQVDGRGL